MKCNVGTVDILFRICSRNSVCVTVIVEKNANEGEILLYFSIKAYSLVELAWLRSKVTQKKGLEILVLIADKFSRNSITRKFECCSYKQ